MTGSAGPGHDGRSRRDGLLALAGLLSALALVAMGTLLFREVPGSAATASLARSAPVAARGPTATAAPTPTTAPVPTTVPAPAPTTTTLPPVPPVLPQPERVPAEPYADVPVVAIGEIEIPKIGLHTPVYEGVWRTVIDVGPGHWPGTADPGGWGNTVFGGHRSTYTEPFRHIDQLVPGDAIVVRTAAGGFTYAVTGSEIVDDSALYIVDQAPGRTITLFACHPVGGTTQRYVVRGTLAA
jgi:sortase A